MEVLTVDVLSSGASQLFAKSLRETGFAVVTNHGIDSALIDENYQAWEHFFSSDKKHDLLFDKETQSGYYPYLSENAKDNDISDLKEFYHYYNWAKLPKEVEGPTTAIFKQMNELAVKLLQWIENETPADIRAQFSMPLTEMIKDTPNTLLRIINYPPLTGSEEPGAVRAAEHEDINLITLLPAASASGLQVRDTQGNWHDVKCDPGMISINTGDMLQECSQGYYPATTHRVVNPEEAQSGSARLSMPLFIHPRDEVVLSERHTRLSYLNERLIENGIRTTEPGAVEAK